MSYLVGFVFGRGFVDFMNLPSPIYQAKVCFFFFPKLINFYFVDSYYFCAQSESLYSSKRGFVDSYY